MKSSTLLALTASALALPGLTPVALADAPPADATLSVRSSSYREDDIDAARVLTGSTERYDINVQQVQWTTPFADKYSIALTGSRDSMSGASPWYTITQPDGSAAVVMSGATIHEERHDFRGALRRYLDNGSIGVNLGYSDETDYQALSGGLDLERHFNDNLTTVAGGFSFSSDDLSPTDAVRYRRILEGGKQSRSLYLSVTQILDANTLIQSGLSYTHLSGTLSDPYKKFDIRPDTRSQWAWTTAWRQFIPAANAALHADYRYYHDTYGVDSHTLDLAWYQNLGKRWQLVPGLRYYSQGAADFFTAASQFAVTTATASDYRLSSYGALSASLKAQVSLDKFTLSLSGERYNSRAGDGLGNGESSPALVDFTRWTLGLDYRY